MRFKQFEIRQCNFIGDPPTPDYHKWNFDIVQWSTDNTFCWSIGHLEWNRKEEYFEFSSCGTRYLESREDGLEEWLLQWCKIKEIEYKYSEIKF